MERQLPTPQAQTALALVNSIVRGDFDAASLLLTPALRKKYPPSRLRSAYEKMIEYGGHAPDHVETTGEWSGDSTRDLGWVYVSIVGPSDSGGRWVEAITVLVSERDGHNLIRRIIWGRP